MRRHGTSFAAQLRQSILKQQNNDYLCVNLYIYSQIPPLAGVENWYTDFMLKH